MTASSTVQELSQRVSAGDRRALARLLSLIEAGDPAATSSLPALGVYDDSGHVIGITGPPGAGKSTLVSELTHRLRVQDSTVGVLAVDPSSPFTGGALLGDRVRMMRHVADPGVFIRSLANRGHLGGLAAAVPPAVRALSACGFATVLIETVGVGQAEVEIARHADTTIVVVTPGMGDAVQASKAGVLEVADVLIVNKADRPGATETVRDLRSMLRLSPTPAGGWRVPVLATCGDTGDGVDELVQALAQHREHANRNGNLRELRTARRVAEFRATAALHLAERLENLFTSKFGQNLLEQVTSGHQSPGHAASDLLAALERPRPDP